MFVLYLLGACALYFKRDEMLGASFYAGFFAVILSSILCFYVFCGRVFYWRNISPLALILALLMAQYLTIFSLSASGIIWSTNKELKGLAGSVNRECKSGAYIYGLPSKDITILRFYLDKSYVLESLGDLPTAPSSCLVSLKSSEKRILQDLSSHKKVNLYFR